jgi:tetratricopeptide (TPR) repeat protein
MKSTLYIILVFLMPVTTVFAQKIDREKLGYFNYTQPPANNELADATYYFMKVEVEDNDAFRRQLAEQAFDGRQFKMATADDKPDFTIEIREGSYSFGKPEKKSYTKDEETLYYYTGSVSYHITLEVTNSEGKELFRDDVRGSENMRGQASGSLSIANDEYVKEKAQAKQDILEKQVTELTEIFHNHFSFVKKTMHLNYVLIKEKKYDYPEFNETSLTLERVHSILNASPEGTAESSELIQKALSFYTEFLADATPSEEKSRKNDDVTASGYYNLGITNFFAGNYEEAKVALEKAASYNEKIMYDVKNMIKVCRDLALRNGLKE